MAMGVHAIIHSLCVSDMLCLTSQYPLKYGCVLRIYTMPAPDVLVNAASRCRLNKLGPEGGAAVARALTLLTGLQILDMR